MNRFSLNRRNIVGLLLALLLLLSLLVGCTSYGKPLIWQVDSPDGQTMYLFGSIHVADEKLYPLPGVIMDAFYSCDYLAVEVDMLAYEQDMEAQMEMKLTMMYPDGSTIADEIGTELYERATAVIAELFSEQELEEVGFPLETLSSFKPLLWENLLEVAAIGRAGLSAECGIDVFFMTEAYERGMEILEVESVADQFDFLLGLTPPLQAILLEGALDVDAAAAANRKIYSLWKRGDTPVLEGLLFNTEGMPPDLADEYMDAMLIQRNIGMTAAAEQYMAEGKKVFYVVGLAHMLGENGIVKLLRQNGYTVTLLKP